MAEIDTSGRNGWGLTEEEVLLQKTLGLSLKKK